eukprot:m.14620 g.14620  ORF g.14620 m.14620 type:complete len:451 (-) comp10223_c1_seq1:233-1585(-)
MKSIIMMVIVLMTHMCVATSSITTSDECRDRRLWPFGSNSVWNVPIGRDAVYMPANIYHDHVTNESDHCDPSSPNIRQTCPDVHGGITPAECVAKGCCFSATPSPDPNHYPWCFTRKHRAGPQSFHNDAEYWTTTSATDPEVEWFDQGWWGKTPSVLNKTTCNETNGWCHCVQLPTAPLKQKFRVPYNFTTDQRYPNNGAASFLLPDNVTVLQTQPLFRCSPGSPLLSSSHGEPQPYPETISILSDAHDSALGAHGGSGLSALGGMIRASEIVPGPPIRHAIKLELYAHQYYYGGHRLNPSTSSNGGRTQYVWPATGSDGYTFGPSPLVYNGTNPHLVPGALLAIPPTVSNNLTLSTEPGRRIRQVLTDFGGYIVDDTACDTAALLLESGSRAAFEAAYNMSLDTSEGPWYDDLVLIFQSLEIVVNNRNTSVGGGGVPLVAPAPPICNEE